MTDIKIRLSYKVAADLEYIRGAVNNLEFSGFGFVERFGDIFVVYDFELLHVGSWGFTQIKPEKTLELLSRPDADKLKCWIHQHPVGNGVPGPNNWSGMDNKTIAETPLGGIPELVKWSISVVHTPRGWVGRMDNHITGKTIHVPVEPTISEGLEEKVKFLLPPNGDDGDDEWEDRDWYDDLEEEDLDSEDPYGKLDDEYDPDDDETKSDNLFARIYNRVTDRL